MCSSDLAELRAAVRGSQKNGARANNYTGRKILNLKMTNMHINYNLKLQAGISYQRVTNSHARVAGKMSRIRLTNSVSKSALTNDGTWN